MVEEALVILFLLLLVGGSKAPAAPDLPRIVPGPEPDEPPGPPGEPPTLPGILSGLIEDEPTPGAGFRVKSSADIFFGTDGIAARALRKGLGREPTGSERTSYYRAITRVRSNWRLYGTLASPATPPIERVDIRNADGTIVQGTITAVQLPVNDRWSDAADQGELPRRLIKWVRNQNGSVRPEDNWEALAHGTPRQWGVLWLPPLVARGLGTNVTYIAPNNIANAANSMDWPNEVYAAAGTSWETWVP